MTYSSRCTESRASLGSLLPAGAPSGPVLIAKVHFMAGNLLRAEKWKLDAGQHLPTRETLIGQPCDGEQQRMTTK